MKVAHLTTVDLSLRFLVLPQLVAVVDAGGEALGISAPGPWVSELEEAGIRHIAISSSTRGVAPLRDLRAALQLWRVLRQEKPDILHTHNPKPGLYGRVLGRLAGVPVVVNTVHGLYATPDDRAVKRLVVYCLEWFAARFSDAELVQNPEDLQLMRRWRIAPRRKLSLLGNGVDLTRFRPPSNVNEREAVRAELGLDPDQIAVGAVGRLVAEKGYLELFEAAQRLPANFVVFAIGPGDDDKADALTKDVLESAEVSGVRFLGMRTDIDRIYRGLDLFVLPSHREGFPRAAMEAAASGLPVIATDIRGCREVVRDGVNGLLVPVRDPVVLAAAISELGEDKARLQEMGAASHVLAGELFDEGTVVIRVLDAYREAAIGKGLPDLASSLIVGEPSVMMRRAKQHESRMLARLHVESIQTGFLSSLGVPFLNRLYRALIGWPDSVVLVADQGSVPVGFVAGVRDTPAFYKHFLRRHSLVASLVGFPQLIRPTNLRRAWETLTYKGVEDNARAELLSMGVIPRMRGRGLGTELGTAMIAQLKVSGPIKVVVAESNSAAIRAYQRMGFRPSGSTEVHRGMASQVLIRGQDRG